MKAWIGWALGLVMVGCASPQKIEYGANRHEQAAGEAEAQGDYRRAAREREAAGKQHRKAEARRYDSYYW
jgi:hypothetical protein